MAKKGRPRRGDGPSKSQLIRDYMSSNPRDKPQAVVAAIKAAHGIDITPQFVSTLKSNDRRNRGKRRRGSVRGPGRPAKVGGASGSGNVSRESLMAAKQLVEKVGGVQKAKAAVDLLATLLG